MRKGERQTDRERERKLEREGGRQSEREGKSWTFCFNVVPVAESQERSAETATSCRGQWRALQLSFRREDALGGNERRRCMEACI